MTTLLAEILEGEPLNDRETEVLAGAAEGETAAQTGARLYLSTETVKSYRKRIIAKLGARNGTHAVALALRAGKLPLGLSGGRNEGVPLVLEAVAASHGPERGERL
jgi:DNA-binding CsgD family transcriptional regulator